MQAGHTVVVIEHNLDVILAADWVLELGPQGGHQGGHLIAACSPQTLQTEGQTPTADALREYQDEILGTATTAAERTAGAALTVAEPLARTAHHGARASELITATAERQR